MKIRYVKYEETHKVQLCEMIGHLYTEDPEGEPMSQEKMDATIRQAEEFPERLQIFMMEDEMGEVVGYAIVQLIWSNEWGGLTANIDEMYVVERARRQGAATGFIENIGQLVPHINRVTLEVTPSNEKALQLYERLGFRQAENTCMERTL